MSNLASQNNKKSVADLCGICTVETSKYKCAQCAIRYCSVKCYKDHMAVQHTSENIPVNDIVTATSADREPNLEGNPLTYPEPLKTSMILDERPITLSEPNLRSLTSLRWPNVPEQPAIEDPLTINDPKPLRLPQYEALARSRDVRQQLEGSKANVKLPDLLRALDNLRGVDRERALESILLIRNDDGDGDYDARDSASKEGSSKTAGGVFEGTEYRQRWMPEGTNREDVVDLARFLHLLDLTVKESS